MDFFFSELKLVMQMERKRTHNPPEYMAGRGETIDLFILLIRACISCPVKEDKHIMVIERARNHYNYTQKWPGKWNHSLYSKIKSTTTPVDSNHI